MCIGQYRIQGETIMNYSARLFMVFIQETFDCCGLTAKDSSRDINVHDGDLSFCPTQVTVAALDAHKGKGKGVCTIGMAIIRLLSST